MGGRFTGQCDTGIGLSGGSTVSLRCVNFQDSFLSKFFLQLNTSPQNSLLFHIVLFHTKVFGFPEPICICEPRESTVFAPDILSISVTSQDCFKS